MATIIYIYSPHINRIIVFYLFHNDFTIIIY